MNQYYTCKYEDDICPEYLITKHYTCTKQIQMDETDQSNENEYKMGRRFN